MLTRDLQRFVKSNCTVFVAALFFFTCHLGIGQEIEPGITLSKTDGRAYSLGNEAIVAQWNVVDGHLKDLMVTDRVHKKAATLSSPFSILLGNQGVLSAADLHFSAAPSFHDLKGDKDASRYSDRLDGKEFEGVLENDQGDLRISYSIVLRNGSRYLRQVLSISAVKRDLPITNVRLIDLHLGGIQVVGSVAGSPLVGGNFFFGVEHPLSVSRVREDHAIADLERTLPLAQGQSITYSSVIGVAPSGQMRRSFLAYVERERAHPYRTFLHYNSWYDAGYFTPYDEADALDRVNLFGHELTQKRGVKLDSFLFDDGWDNHKSLWKFNDGFPDGFASVREAAEKYGADPGVWMSPWGGYSNPKKERIEFGKAAGYEIVANGYALSGPKYYAAFRDVCMDMIQKYGVNQFKFDGTGNVDSVFPGSSFDSDFSAAIQLISELRT